LAPIILALIFYFYHSKHPSSDTRNHGQLVQPMRKMPKNLLFQEQTQTHYEYIDGDWQVVQNASAVAPQNPSQNLSQNILLEKFSGKWLMIYYQNAAVCDEICIKHLYVLRQLRLSLGKEGGRFIPIWLKGEAQLTPQLQSLYDNPHSNLRLLKILPEKDTTKNLANWLNTEKNKDIKMGSGLYLIDPHLNYIMHYPSIDEPLKIIKDLQLLLKWSRIG